MTTRADTTGRTPVLWVALFTVAATLTSLLFHCATPYPSLAALAAIHLSRRDGVLLMLASWVVSQGIGFCLMGYPWEAATALSGLAVGVAAVLGLLAAGAADTQLRGLHVALRLVVAYVVAFAAFKLGIAAASPAIGHTDAALSVPVMLRQFGRNAAILAALYAAYRAAVAAGVPALRIARAPLVSATGAWEK